MAVILLMAGMSPATTVWNAVDATDIADGYANWGDADNWTAGLPGTEGSGLDDKAVFNVPAAVEARVTDAQTLKDLVMGDGGSATVPEENLVRIMDGGVLTTEGNWMAVGYNHPAKLVVENGGVYNHAGHFWWGMKAGAEAVIEINGGTVTNGGDFSLGGYPNPEGGIATVNLNAGLLSIDHWSDGKGVHDGSVMDIKFGTFEIFDDGDQTYWASEYIAADRIIGFGGLSTPVVVYENNVTTITAPDPLNRNPVYTEVAPDSALELTWTNLDPVAPAIDVWVDVRFGTSPDMTANSQIVTQGLNDTSATVDVSSVTEPTTYYWQVNSYVYGDPSVVDYNDPNTAAEIVEGEVTPFIVTPNVPPTVAITTPPTATWINEPIDLQIELVDDTPSEVTYLWTSDDPNAIFEPSNTVAEPTVKVDYHSGPFTVTVTVDDGFNDTDSASVTHDCAESPCQAATAVINLDEQYVGDIVTDCKIDLADFAALASGWLADFALDGPTPIPQEE
ncbi:PKD domain-containing protein [Anaerohalosphaera lusitana]|uniref:PKD domain-containing protein n=1 Tax=Anaerohalosphaera lusitana TaxID=1936003 RepID=UPI0011BAC367|nr:PKD domain-containing protein [Anaerohalosphaera lusitana]